MTSRHTLAQLLPLVFVLAGCSSSHGPAPSPSGMGVCCPVSDIIGCSPTPVAAGGWAADEGGCTRTISAWGGLPFERATDDMGCLFLREGTSATGCCGCVADAGVDAGSSPCDGLGAAACFAEADCAPVFDDACCPSCIEGPCADCTDYEYVGCEPFEGCRGSCGVSVPWGCFPAAADCSAATALDADSCSEPGCVPHIAPATEPSPMGACTPITANSCTVVCRADPPDCPEGSVAEGDGSCWTGWCIPAFVCE